MAVTIAVANQKGGVGKTTTTANLAVTLARHDLRVLAIDTDPQSNLTTSFGLDKAVSPSLADSLLHRDAELPRYRVQDSTDVAIDLVPGTPELAAVESELQTKLGREMRLREHLMRLDQDYDFVLVDTPPSLGVLTLNALVAAQWVIIPTEARFFSLRGLQMLTESIEEVTIVNPHLRVLGIVLNKFDRRLREEKHVAGYLHEQWAGEMFASKIPTNSKILEASSSGLSIFAPGARGRGVRRAVDAYEALAEEVLKRAA